MYLKVYKEICEIEENISLQIARIFFQYTGNTGNDLICLKQNLLNGKHNGNKILSSSL